MPDRSIASRGYTGGDSAWATRVSTVFCTSSEPAPHRRARLTRCSLLGKSGRVFDGWCTLPSRAPVSPIALPAQPRYINPVLIKDIS